MNWRKERKITALLLLALLLALTLILMARQDEKWMAGLVTEIQTDGDGNVTAFVVESEGKRTGVLLAEKTVLWPQREGNGARVASEEAFQAQLSVDSLADVKYYPRRDKLETADGERIRAYWATSAEIAGTLEREALILWDGTPIDVLERTKWIGDRTYRLSDGTELLRVDDTRGPEGIYIAGQENFADLSETAQEKVRAYYEAQGTLYDEMEELEKAYAEYRKLGEDFQRKFVRQEVTTIGANDRVMYFATTVSLPLGYDDMAYMDQTLCAAFNRQTGEEIDICDLFGVPWEDVRRRLPELAGWGIEPAVAAEMTEVLKPEWICFGQDGLNTRFPAGSLPSNVLNQEGPPEEWGEPQMVGYLLSVEWGNLPEGFVRPWAIPKSVNQ